MGRPKGSKNKKTLEKIAKESGAVKKEYKAPSVQTIAIPENTVQHIHTSARLQDWNRYVEMNIAIAATGSICRLPGSEGWPATAIAARAVEIAKAVSANLSGE